MSNVLVPLVAAIDFDKQPYYISAGNDSMPDSNLSRQIIKYQKIFLTRVLGNQELYNLNNDNLGAFPTTQKWIDFINGVDYLNGDDNIDYNGIIEPLMNFIYYWYLRNNQLTTGSFGGMKMAVVNAKLRDDGQKASDAWNEMCELVGNTTDLNPTVWNYLEFHDFEAEMRIFTKIQNIY